MRRRLKIFHNTLACTMQGENSDLQLQRPGGRDLHGPPRSVCTSLYSRRWPVGSLLTRGEFSSSIENYTRAVHKQTVKHFDCTTGNLARWRPIKEAIRVQTLVISGWRKNPLLEQPIFTFEAEWRKSRHSQKTSSMMSKNTQMCKCTFPTNKLYRNKELILHAVKPSKLIFKPIFMSQSSVQ